VSALSLDPQNPHTIYAATSTNGAAGTSTSAAYRSTDGGDTWQKITLGGPKSLIDAFAIDPQNTKTIYAAFNGVYRSIDGGNTWQPFDNGLTTTNTLLAGTGGGGVLDFQYG
jgi:photosystem II stability/assembly factor-like uncharacterized protein